jgi:hypothetical protein
VSSDVAKNRIISAKQPDLDVQVTIKVQCESQIASLYIKLVWILGIAALMLMVIKFGAQKVKLINFVGLEEANEQRKLRKFFSFKTS